VPLISTSTYTKPNRLWRNAHIQTILPSISRNIYPAIYKRQRMELLDGDFLDIDWSTGFTRPRTRLVIICHGLEGSSKAPYTKGMARRFRKADWDVVLINFRSCSGELNRLPRSYHSGETGDLAFVLENVFQKYDEIALVGFSLGGNVILKYLGEQGKNISNKILGAVTFSVPCDLATSGMTLSEATNKIYMSRFLRLLGRKVRVKHQRGDQIASPDSINFMTSFWEFDDAFTAPLHGFRGADDYYQKSSSKQYLNNISIPALMVNAQNDPFLSPECYPENEARESSFFHLETPEDGGHCGFPTANLIGNQWHENRAIEFLGNL